MRPLIAASLGVLSGDAWFIAAFALVLSLYAVKALALTGHRGRLAALVIFLAAMTGAVPLTWLLSPLRGDPGVFPQAIYIGEPLSTLLIPCLSFVWDWSALEPKQAPEAWFWRAWFEIAIAVPVWFFAWQFFQLFILEWTYI
jgi:hypothetical protein